MVTGVYFKVVCSCVTTSIFLDGGWYVFVVLGLVAIVEKIFVLSEVVSGFCVYSAEVPCCGFEGELIVDGDPILKTYEIITIITQDWCNESLQGYILPDNILSLADDTTTAEPDYQLQL